MTLKFYQYPKCSTCKRAVAFLKQQGVQFLDIDISQSPPSVAELKQMLKAYDGNLRKLFNTSGIQYRELGLKDKLADMSEQEALQMLSSNGKLVKRPFLLDGSKGAVGFVETEWKERGLV